MSEMPFRFTVERIDEDMAGDPVPVTWRVSLPHQCDGWDISGEAYDGTPHEQAVADLERFIAEAHEVLEHLKAGRQVAYDWKPGAPTPTMVIS